MCRGKLSTLMLFPSSGFYFLFPTIENMVVTRRGVQIQPLIRFRFEFLHKQSYVTFLFVTKFIHKICLYVLLLYVTKFMCNKIYIYKYITNMIIIRSILYKSHMCQDAFFRKTLKYKLCSCKRKRN